MDVSLIQLHYFSRTSPSDLKTYTAWKINSQKKLDWQRVSLHPFKLCTEQHVFIVQSETVIKVLT